MKKLPIIKLKGEVKLEIGCGNNKQPGFIGIDVRDCGQEIVWDVRDGIPFPDNSIDTIWSSHVLEHFDNDECKELFREIYRVLKPGGTIESILPHAMDPTAFYFDHITFWNEERVSTLIGVPGLEGFEVVENKSTRETNNIGMIELLFKLKKL